MLGYYKIYAYLYIFIYFLKEIFYLVYFLKVYNTKMPGYVGFANLPNQIHRKSVKRGFEFTLMVVGEYLLR